jgi:hypothetical protein
MSARAKGTSVPSAASDEQPGQQVRTLELTPAQLESFSILYPWEFEEVERVDGHLRKLPLLELAS